MLRKTWMGAAGVERGFRLLNDLFTVSDPASGPPETGDGGEQGEGEQGEGERSDGCQQGPALQGRQDCVFLATDSLLLKETGAWRVQARNVCVVTSPFPVVHTAGAGACGDSGECRALAANLTLLEHVQVVCHAAVAVRGFSTCSLHLLLHLLAHLLRLARCCRTRLHYRLLTLCPASTDRAPHVSVTQVVAEWWMLAAARRAWILTRGSSFGLSAAARGRFLSAAYPHPFCHVREATTAGAALPWHVGRVFTVHEHKVR